MNSLRRIRKNRFLVVIPLISFLSLTILPSVENLNKIEAAEFGLSAEFLVQQGISFYDQGRFAEAMMEFEKALIVDPNSTVAKEFLKQIKGIFGKKEGQEGITKILAVEEALDRTESILEGLSPQEKEKLVSAEKKPVEIARTFTLQPLVNPGFNQIIPQKTILLDDSIKSTQPSTPLELEIDSAIILKGDNIKRILNNTPDRINIIRQDQDNLLITATGIGFGIFHVWDNSGRWTFHFRGKQKKFIGILQDEYENMDVPIGLADSFKINYSFDWSSFHSGTRIDNTQRQSLGFSQRVGVYGETPYGRFDASSTINRVNKQYQVDSLTMGLTDAHLGKLEHVNLRLFDFNPGFPAYGFPSADLRGARINAPMFNNKLDYTTFWGGLPEGNYTQLSPGLGRTKEAYLEGVGLKYVMDKNARYDFYYAHTYGRELSQPVLTDKAFGFGAFYKIGIFNLESELANDNIGHISYTTNGSFNLPKMNISLGFTDEDRDFVSPLGGGTGGGSTSARFGVRLYPTNNFSLSNTLTAVRDSRFYNPDDPKRPNYSFASEANWQVDPHTNMDFGYTREDTKGSISPGISQTKKINIRKQFFFLRRLSTNLSYVNSTNKSFLGSASNYDRNAVSGGLGFNIIGDLNGSIYKTYNFIEDRMTGENAESNVLETALSYYSRILQSPFYGNFRVMYRDEEDAASVLSYLSGEDRLELYSELDYRPNPYLDGYLSCRVANVWAENEGVAKHLDLEIRYGLRLVWDTGLRWNTKGHVDGFVFNDLNGDGVKDKDEQGIPNVVINTTGKKTDASDEKGYYNIKNIVGRKARVAVDLKTLPRGHTFTTAAFYDIDIKHGATKRLDFGLTTRSEIVGVVFVDINGNNEFDRGDDPISGVVMVLDDKERVVTDQSGQYLFRKVSPGEHNLRIDLTTLPTKYIPKVPLRKKVLLEEGMTFFYNIPLRQARIK
ncbi:MAG: SdrD B-like domain-containing protein [Candidatus Omnitrophica bacterium]|nr:SdrD B-like domain-containing protein [Candidatus Omnitrophota bacterium]MDD5352604.1 SdrD B-like domain-containing protein [Candidatus Omnitrophota bacterium]MDD5550202.1 SdrD B-like domain-containing protein [Candidatus Omnitrophota bacterium]